MVNHAIRFFRFTFEISWCIVFVSLFSLSSLSLSLSSLILLPFALGDKLAA